MAKQKPRTLSGFMELLPDKQVQFDRMVELLRRSYSLYGFTPLDTPVIEASEVLLAKGGGETEKQMYRFTKGGCAKSWVLTPVRWQTTFHLYFLLRQE